MASHTLIDRREIEPVCDGPYCIPVYENGKTTGLVTCPDDCPLCDEIENED